MPKVEVRKGNILEGDSGWSGIMILLPLRESDPELKLTSQLEFPKYLQPIKTNYTNKKKINLKK